MPIFIVRMPMRCHTVMAMAAMTMITCTISMCMGRRVVMRVLSMNVAFLVFPMSMLRRVVMRVLLMIVTFLVFPMSVWRRVVMRVLFMIVVCLVFPMCVWRHAGVRMFPVDVGRTVAMIMRSSVDMGMLMIVAFSIVCVRVCRIRVCVRFLVSCIEIRKMARAEQEAPGPQGCRVFGDCKLESFSFILNSCEQQHSLVSGTSMCLAMPLAPSCAMNSLLEGGHSRWEFQHASLDWRYFNTTI